MKHQADRLYLQGKQTQQLSGPGSMY